MSDANYEEHKECDNVSNFLRKFSLKTDEGQYLSIEYCMYISQKYICNGTVMLFDSRLTYKNYCVFSLFF